MVLFMVFMVFMAFMVFTLFIVMLMVLVLCSRSQCGAIHGCFPTPARGYPWTRGIARSLPIGPRPYKGFTTDKESCI